MGWLGYALLSTVFVSFSSILEKLGLKGTDTLLVTTIQSIMTTAFLIIACFIFKRFTNGSISTLTSHNSIFIILAGAVTGLSWFCYLNALKHSTISKVDTIDRLSLLFTIVLSASLLGEPLELKNIAGALFMAFGAFLIVVGL